VWNGDDSLIDLKCLLVINEVMLCHLRDPRPSWSLGRACIARKSRGNGYLLHWNGWETSLDVQYDVSKSRNVVWYNQRHFLAISYLFWRVSGTGTWLEGGVSCNIVFKFKFIKRNICPTTVYIEKAIVVISKKWKEVDMWNMLPTITRKRRMYRNLEHNSCKQMKETTNHYNTISLENSFWEKNLAL